MFQFFCKKNKDTVVREKTEKINQPLSSSMLSSSYDANINELKKLFEDDDTFRTREISVDGEKNTKFFLAFTDGMVDSAIINDAIIRPLLTANFDGSDDSVLDMAENSIITINSIQRTDNMKEAVEAITYGDTLLLSDRSPGALLLSTKGFQARSIAEPDSEKVLSGPRDGFCEVMMTNLSLVRRRLQTNDLKMKFYKVGYRSNIKACVCYLDSLTDKKILKDLYKRLDKISIDSMLDSNYITELIRDTPYSIFPTTGYTERPDVVVAKLLEGRIAVFLDGTPVVITIPYLFVENFQSNEDYYLNFLYTSFSRIIRIIGFMLTILVPGFYIAIVAFHHELLPPRLLINITVDQMGVPLPAILEVFVMLFVFDVLREAGVRMPSSIGSALGIVGALVIGQAAVEARLVASPTIIVVGITGITSLLIPKLDMPIIAVRTFILIMSSTLGLFGLMCGLSIVFIYILSLKSFGIKQFTSGVNMSLQGMKDIFVRAPWWTMINRPGSLFENSKRLNVHKEENES